MANRAGRSCSTTRGRNGLARPESLYSFRAAEAVTVTRPAALFILGLALAGGAQRPATTPAQEWRTFDHDLAGTRFSPLTEINTGNVTKLAKAWTFNFPPPPGGRGGPLGLG